MAPLDALHAQQAEMVRAMSLGVAMALVAAAAGGWLIGRQTLKPLTRMAEQASRINERDPRERLVAPPVGDELGQLAVSFNGLLDRLASALNHQRQFMADASHELRTPVSVVRTADAGHAGQRRSLSGGVSRVAGHRRRAGEPALPPGRRDVPAVARRGSGRTAPPRVPEPR